MEGAFSDPDIPDGEETVYRGLVGGESAGGGTNRISHVPGGYRQTLSMSVRDDAVYDAAIDFRRTGGTLAVESYRLDTRYRDEPVSVEEGRFRVPRILGEEA